MVDPITRIQLENASRDADDLGRIVNGAVNYLGTGLVPTRFGGPVKTAKKLEKDIQDSVIWATYRNLWSNVTSYIAKDLVSYDIGGGVVNVYVANRATINEVPGGPNDAWTLFLTGSGLTDGDKGDIVVTNSGTEILIDGLGTAGSNVIKSASKEEVRNAIGFGARPLTYSAVGTYALDPENFSPGAVHRITAAGTVQIDVSALAFYLEYEFNTFDGSTLVLDSSGSTDRFINSNLLYASIVKSITVLPNRRMTIKKIAGGRISVNYLEFPLEDGDWTPVISFATPGNLNINYAAGRKGRYVRQGKVCKLWLTVATGTTFTHTTAAGALIILGLPFLSANNDIFAEGVLGYTGITNATRPHMNLMLAPNTNILNIQAHGSAAGITSISASDTPTGGTLVFRGQIDYEVA